MATSLPELFSSKSRSKLLLVLSELTEPACLNELAELTESSVCATSAALTGLLKERIVKRSSRRNETVYLLDKSSDEGTLIDEIRKVLVRDQLVRRAQTYGTRPAESLAFASESTSFLRKVKALNVHP